MRNTAVLFLVLLLLAPTALAAAQEPEPPAGAMLIILDASGSMKNVDEDGVPFIDKARAAILELTEALPDDTQVGLRVYGHREPNTDPGPGCQDTELLVPVAPLDRDAIRTAIAGVSPSGFTPIGLSLQQAADDLPETGPRSIVLISDGEDTCAPPDPCEVAENLFGEEFDVRIESVGFLIDTGSAAEQQLRCISDVTGGSYSEVGRADELISKLGQVAIEFLEWRVPVLLSGALDRLAAPSVPLVLDPGWRRSEGHTYALGEFVSLLMPGETRWFQIELWENEGFWAFADLESPSGIPVSGEFEAIIIDPAGNRVEVPAHPFMETRVTLPGVDNPMIGASPNNPPAGNRQPGIYLLGVHWDSPAEVFLANAHITVEITGDHEYGRWTELEGSLDTFQAPVLLLAPDEADTPTYRRAHFTAPLAAGETRWYRLDMEPGEVMNVFALFPINRVVGAGLEGEFAVELLDLGGNPVGRAHEETPFMARSFGDHPRSVNVSATTSRDPDPVPQSVLIGFTWNGPGEATSELRFEVETDFDPGRLRPDEPPTGDEEPGTTTTDSPFGTTTVAPSVAGQPEAANDDAGGGFPILVVGIGFATLAGAIAGGFTLLRRRRVRGPR